MPPDNQLQPESNEWLQVEVPITPTAANTTAAMPPPRSSDYERIHQILENASADPERILSAYEEPSLGPGGQDHFYLVSGDAVKPDWLKEGTRRGGPQLNMFNTKCSK